MENVIQTLPVFGCRTNLLSLFGIQIFQIVEVCVHADTNLHLCVFVGVCVWFCVCQQWEDKKKNTPKIRCLVEPFPSRLLPSAFIGLLFPLNLSFPSLLFLVERATTVCLWCTRHGWWSSSWKVTYEKALHTSCLNSAFHSQTLGKCQEFKFTWQLLL